MRDGACAGFKYFDCKGIKKISIRTRGYCKGEFHVKTSWNGPSLGSIPVEFSNIWRKYTANIVIPDGVHALYFEYKGNGGASFASFELEQQRNKTKFSAYDYDNYLYYMESITKVWNIYLQM